jgi:hypothetical protein
LVGRSCKIEQEQEQVKARRAKTAGSIEVNDTTGTLIPSSNGGRWRWKSVNHSLKSPFYKPTLPNAGEYRRIQQLVIWTLTKEYVLNLIYIHML